MSHETILKILCLLMLTLSLLGASGDTADDSSIDNLHYVNYACPQSNFSYSLHSTFQENLNYTLFSVLPANASVARFSNFTIGVGIDQVHALYYCRGDLGGQSCRDCIQAAATTATRKCNLLKEGIVWYQECTLRYANRSIVSVEEEIPMARYYNYSSMLSSYYLDQYKQKFYTVMDQLVNAAAYNASLHGFDTVRVNLSSSVDQLILGGLVQCSPFIIGPACDQCLRAALRQQDAWSNTMIFLPSCNLMFNVSGKLPTLTTTGSSSGRRRPTIVIIVTAVVGILLLLIGFVVICIRCRGREKQGPPVGLQCYTYSELRNMTGGFQTKLGEGAFGAVYYGRLIEGTEVAVKLLYAGASLASEQFSTEVNLLKGIHHKNLVSLIGYCAERTNMALILEYMPGGNLQDLLAGPDSLSWKKRIEIAIDVAQGLDYLHHGCVPKIVHRDVKTANILLDRHLQAKISDFGMSKIFPDEYQRYITTRVIGTPGYVDPQYHETEHLNEKSDTYSFGVVLLELITGRAAIIINVEEGEGRTKLVQWVRRLHEKDDIVSLIDQRMQEVVSNQDSIFAATELAMKCIKPTGEQRPSMTDVLTVLRNLPLEIEQRDHGSMPLVAFSVGEMDPATQ